MDARKAPGSAHVIVLGNEKGGSGKSTLAMHIIVALLKAGRRVASIDTDSRQLTLSRYLANRARWSEKTGQDLAVPTHFPVKFAKGDLVSEIEAREFAVFSEIIDELGQAFDFIVVDTPASDTYKMRLSHLMADTLVTPINDSFIDLDVLGRIGPEDFAVSGISQYAELVIDARRQRSLVDKVVTDWVVVRNRLSSLSSRNQLNVITGLKRLSSLLNFRIADGISERVTFREFFPMGLTALDDVDHETVGVQLTASRLTARREIAALIASLRLPLVAVASEAAVINDDAPALKVAVG
jgi:chromosome partitioning protein